MASPPSPGRAVPGTGRERFFARYAVGGFYTITGIAPPAEVDSALAGINTAHNHVSSEISLAQAAADRRIVQSRRAVEIETLNAEAEVEPLLALASACGAK